MSKAVLVMDMPGSCYQCPFGNDNFECDVIGRPLDVNQKIEKLDWCPLRPMPEKKEKDSFLIEAIKNDCFDGMDSDTAYYNGKDDGWNACIDAIGGVDGEEAK